MKWTEKLRRRETVDHGLLFLFKTGSSYFLPIVEFVIWTNLALNSQRSTWVGEINSLYHHAWLWEILFIPSHQYYLLGFLFPFLWGQLRWSKSVIPAVGKLRQYDREFKVVLGYTTNVRSAWVTKDPDSKELWQWCPLLWKLDEPSWLPPCWGSTCRARWEVTGAMGWSVLTDARMHCSPDTGHADQTACRWLWAPPWSLSHEWTVSDENRLWLMSEISCSYYFQH